MMVGKGRLIAMVNTQCDGVREENSNSAGNALFETHEVQLKAYEDGSTIPLGCKYFKMLNGTARCDFALKGYSVNLGKCRLFSRE